MRRKFFNLLSALSLLLCAATVVLWVRSYNVSDIVRRDFRRISINTQSGHSVELRSAGGGLTVTTAAYHNSDPDLRLWRTPLISAEVSWAWTADEKPIYPQLVPTGLSRSWSNAGFAWMECSFRTSWFIAYDEQSALVPYWFVAMGATVIPLLRLSRVLTSRRQFARRRGERCRLCGYDLRATPDRCPECGTPVAPSSNAIAKGPA